MKQRLFQYAVLFHERLLKGDSNAIVTSEFKTQIIVEPAMILAQDEKIAALKIARQIDEKYMDVLNDIEILIRPFA